MTLFLTPEETPLSDKVLIHYSGTILEFKEGIGHVCELCRDFQLRDFFNWFATLPTRSEDFEPYIQDVQDKVKLLSITKEEWDDYYAVKRAQEEAWLEEFDFFVAKSKQFERITTAINERRRQKQAIAERELMENM